MMTNINPITGAYLAAQPQVARLAEDKAEQVRRAQVLARNATPTARTGVANAADRFEPAVESVDVVDPSQDDQHARDHRRKRPKRRPPPQPGGDEPDAPHLDVSA
jgi:hypothetical protein